MLVRGDGENTACADVVFDVIPAPFLSLRFVFNTF